MPRRAHLIFAAAATLALAGCSSGVSHPIVGLSPMHILVPSPGGSASALIVESSDSVLRAHLLTPADLPSGWKSAASADAVVDASCDAISDPAYNRLPLHVEAAFTAASGMPKLAETLAYGSTAEVDDAWSAYDQAMNSCGQLTKLPFPRTGNPVDAWQAVTTVGRLASTTFVLTRKGDLLEAVTYSDSGKPSPSEVQDYVERADVASAGIR